MNLDIEIEFVKRFSDQMLIELINNNHKGSVLDWGDFDNMITDLECHKAKMLIAIRCKNKKAIKEYIADCANILMAIGNKFELYDLPSINDGSVSVIDNEKCIITTQNNTDHINPKLA